MYFSLNVNLINDLI